jgi:hypothetical protein
MNNCSPVPVASCHVRLSRQYLQENSLGVTVICPCRWLPHEALETRLSGKLFTSNCSPVPVAGCHVRLSSRVSFKTSFDSKQRKLEPKLVSALSETKHLFWLFRFYTKTKNFSVSIEPKQTEEQPKQCDREHILVFFSENLDGFGLFLVCFQRVCFGSFGSIPKQRDSMFRLNRDKQKTNRNSLIESMFWYFSENFGLFGFVSVCFVTVLFVAVVSI